jgi:hypothetical protein
MEAVKRAVAIKVIFIIVLAMLMGACKKEIYNAPEDQPVYFEYHFLNFAWGVKDFGWLLDRHGTIRRFELPEEYNSVNHGDYLSLEQIENNLAQADSVVGEVNAAKLEKKIRLIAGASEGEITKVHRQGADMGLGVYGCFKFNLEMQAYQYILLSADGDHQQYNRSPDAEKLVKWLNELVD